MPECPTRAYNIAHVIFWSPDAFAESTTIMSRRPALPLQLT
jgi:hypothetical protein